MHSGGAGRALQTPPPVCTLHRHWLPFLLTKEASLTSGGVVGCGHELIAGEAHLWGCQVGTELLWLQLNSKVVLVDSFLGRKVRDHFSLLPSQLVKDKAHRGALFTFFRKSSLLPCLN